MVDSTTIGSATIDEKKDLGTGEAATYAYWMGQEKIAEKEERAWIKRARQIVKRYRDERSVALQEANQFNILWSNVQTLIPTLYARTPKADVERRFRDDDPVARLASMLLERCISYSADKPFDRLMRAVVEDRLLPGRGIARVMYVPHFGNEIQEEAKTEEYNEDANPEFADADDQAALVSSPGDEPATDKDQPPLREVDYEEVVPRYVYWQDYREGPARQWEEVPWVRYRSYLTRAELKKRFGNAKASKVSLDFTPSGQGDKKDDKVPPDLYKKAIVDEYWDKSAKKVCWIAPGTPDMVLDEQPDPLNLPDFFPSPNPLFSTTTTDKRIPVPDYTEYQDQARELDNLTARIDTLTKALAVKGIYPGENKQVLQQLFDSGDNQLIPVEDWAAFTDKIGGGFIQYLPIEQVAQTLIQLYNARDRVKGILYEITGIGDIMRGMTSPDETLGAQELKANFSTRRITPQQKQVAEFARDMFRLMGGVIAEHFSPKTISEVTGFPQLKFVPPLPPAPPQQIPAPQQQPQQPGAQPALAPPQPGAEPGMQSQLPMAMQQMQPNPAFAQWAQQAQQVQAVMAANQEKQQEFDAACALIKQDGVHGFRIDIEADSTIAPDEQAEKRSRTEFMQQFIPFMETVVPIAQGNPAMADLAKEMTLFVVRGWRVARPLEETIEKAFDAIAKMQPNPKATGQDKAPKGQQGADPEQLALEAHKVQTDAAVKTQTSDAQMQIAREKNATALMIQNQKTTQANQELEAELPFKHAEIVQESARIQNQNDAERLRADAIAQRGAKNLQ